MLLRWLRPDNKRPIKISYVSVYSLSQFSEALEPLLRVQKLTFSFSYLRRNNSAIIQTVSFLFSFDELNQIFFGTNLPHNFCS